MMKCNAGEIFFCVVIHQVINAFNQTNYALQDTLIYFDIISYSS